MTRKAEDKLIGKLNRWLATELGSVSVGGEGTWAWKRASELFYLFKETQEVMNPGGLIALVVPVYRRRCWADRLGDVYVISKWRLPPISIYEWEASSLGKEFPYPSKGQYYPAEMENEAGCVKLRIGELPDEDLTQLLIYSLKGQLGKTALEHFYECKNAAQGTKDKEAADWLIEAAEVWPAFDNPEPGTKANYSFGGIKDVPL